MGRRSLAGALVALVWVAQPALAEAPFGALPALGLAGAQPVAADFLKPFETPLPLRVTGASGTERIELQHCQDWLQHRSKAVGSDNDAAWRIVLLQTVPCEAMALLAAARPAAHDALPADLTQSLATRHYPGTLWPMPSPDEQARAVASGRHLGQLSGVAQWQRVPVQPPTRPPQHALSLRTSAWQLRLTPLARGDFDGDGWNDVACLWQAESRQGSLTDARLVVLTRPGGQGSLRQLPTVPLLDALPPRP